MAADSLVVCTPDCIGPFQLRTSSLRPATWCAMLGKAWTRLFSLCPRFLLAAELWSSLTNTADVDVPESKICVMPQLLSVPLLSPARSLLTSAAGDLSPGWEDPLPVWHAWSWHGPSVTLPSVLGKATETASSNPLLDNCELSEAGISSRELPGTSLWLEWLTSGSLICCVCIGWLVGFASAITGSPLPIGRTFELLPGSLSAEASGIAGELLEMPSPRLAWGWDASGPWVAFRMSLSIDCIFSRSMVPESESLHALNDNSRFRRSSCDCRSPTGTTLGLQGQWLWEVLQWRLLENHCSHLSRSESQHLLAWAV